MAVWKNVHRVHNLTEVWSLSTSVHTCPLIPFTSSKSIQPTFSPATYQCINAHLLLCCRWVCFVDPSVTAVSEGRLVDCCRGEEGCLAELPPEGGNVELTRKIQSCRSRQGAINCRGSVGSQCPLCRWGIFCWWPATDPHTPGGRGACTVISYGHKRDKVPILKEM